MPIINCQNPLLNILIKEAKTISLKESCSILDMEQETDVIQKSRYDSF